MTDMERLQAMAFDSEGTWDLSDSDVNALRSVFFRIVHLQIENEELQQDKLRLDWIDRDRDGKSRMAITGQLDHHLAQGWKAREAIDATAGYWEPEFINWFKDQPANG